MKKPNLGDWIEHSEPTFGRVNYGKVVQLLSAQFCYDPPNSQYIRHCMYKEMWRPVKKAEALANVSESLESKAKTLKKRKSG